MQTNDEIRFWKKGKKGQNLQEINIKEITTKLYNHTADQKYIWVRRLLIKVAYYSFEEAKSPALNSFTKMFRDVFTVFLSLL